MSNVHVQVTSLKERRREDFGLWKHTTLLSEMFFQGILRLVEFEISNLLENSKVFEELSYKSSVDYG